MSLYGENCRTIALEERLMNCKAQSLGEFMYKKYTENLTQFTLRQFIDRGKG